MRITTDEGSLTEFKRTCWRRSTIRRHLDCGCVIDHGETYSYHVAKVRGIRELVQVLLCRYCS